MNNPRRHKKNPLHQGRKNRHLSEQHWMQEGIAGWDYLLDGLEPCTLALDYKLARSANHLIRSSGRGEEERVALLVPPSEGGFWQVSYLASPYSLYLLNDEYDEIQERAAAVFGFQVTTSERLEKMVSAFTLVANTNTNWENREEFGYAVRSFGNLLTEGGRAFFFLVAEGKEAEIFVYWKDGSRTPLSGLVKGDIFAIPTPAHVDIINLQKFFSTGNSEVPEFLRRNRRFFGNGMEIRFFDRLNESDFRGESIRPQGVEPQWAVMLAWDGLSEKPED